MSFLMKIYWTTVSILGQLSIGISAVPAVTSWNKGDYWGFVFYSVIVLTVLFLFIQFVSKTIKVDELKASLDESEKKFDKANGTINGVLESVPAAEALLEIAKDRARMLSTETPNTLRK